MNKTIQGFDILFKNEKMLDLDSVESYRAGFKKFFSLCGCTPLNLEEGVLKKYEGLPLRSYLSALFNLYSGKSENNLNRELSSLTHQQAIRELFSEFNSLMGPVSHDTPYHTKKSDISQDDRPAFFSHPHDYSKFGFASNTLFATTLGKLLNGGDVYDLGSGGFPTGPELAYSIGAQRYVSIDLRPDPLPILYYIDGAQQYVGNDFLAWEKGKPEPLFYFRDSSEPPENIPVDAILFSEEEKKFGLTSFGKSPDGFRLYYFKNNFFPFINALKEERNRKRLFYISGLQQEVKPGQRSAKEQVLIQRLARVADYIVMSYSYDGCDVSPKLVEQSGFYPISSNIFFEQMTQFSGVHPPVLYINNKLLSDTSHS